MFVIVKSTLQMLMLRPLMHCKSDGLIIDSLLKVTHSMVPSVYVILNMLFYADENIEFSGEFQNILSRVFFAIMLFTNCEKTLSHSWIMLDELLYSQV